MVREVNGKYHVTDRRIYMDGILQNELRTLHHAVTYKDFDGIWFVDGYEGYGKSVLQQQMGYFLAWLNRQLPERYVDKVGRKIKRSGTGWSAENIIFSPKEFKKACIDAERFQVIIWDESRGGINARRAMGDMNNAITDMLSEIRQKNLLIGITAPTFMDIDRNIAVWRSRFLIHVIGDGFNRGVFKFYNIPRKRLLYFKGKQQYYNYNVVASCFSGRFLRGYTVEEKGYREKKAKNMRIFREIEQSEEFEINKPRILLQRNSMVAFHYYRYKPDVIKMSKLLGMAETTYKDIVRKYKPIFEDASRIVFWEDIEKLFMQDALELIDKERERSKKAIKDIVS